MPDELFFNASPALLAVGDLVDGNKLVTERDMKVNPLGAWVVTVRFHGYKRAKKYTRADRVSFARTSVTP